MRTDRSGSGEVLIKIGGKDRLSLAIDAKEKLRNMEIDRQNHAYEHAVDKPEIDQWTWS